jgi:hypothetical protein
MKDPVLVSSVEGVGTKLKIAFATNRHDTIGQDLVNHCINDIAVIGARPLFFLDYIGGEKLDPVVFRQILKGFATEDQVAALIAHELVHYTRSHEEDIEERLNSWMPFREDAINRSRWDHEKEADRLTPRFLGNAGLDPFAATEVPKIVDKLLTGTPGWNGGKINFPIDSADERGYRIQFELKHNKLQQTPQTIGQMPAVKDELGARP